MTASRCNTYSYLLDTKKKWKEVDLVCSCEHIDSVENNKKNPFAIRSVLIWLELLIMGTLRGASYVACEEKQKS